MKYLSKHGQRAIDQTVLSVPMGKALRENLRRLASKDGKRPVAQFIRLHLEAIVAEQRGVPTELRSVVVAEPQAPYVNSGETPIRGIPAIGEGLARLLHPRANRAPRK